ncbi:MAG: ankyrin repeat domain-containing protein, partial [Cyanobacteria bacterium P01_D01_bin.123]
LLKSNPEAALTQGFTIGTTGLILAAHRGFYDICQLLLQAGAPVNARERASHSTALHWACEGGHRPLVELLLDREADRKAVDDWYGLTPLGWTAIPRMMPEVHDDRSGTAHFLISQGATVDPFTATIHGLHEHLNADTVRQRLGFAARGRTPLHVAVERDRIAAIPILLELGANPSTPDAWGVSPRALALAKHRPLASTFNRDPNDLSALLVAQDFDAAAQTEPPESPGLLHFLAERGLTQAVQTLLHMGADPNTEVTLLANEQKSTTTPLHQAIACRHADTAKVLLDAGAHPNQASEINGITPLHTAAANGDTQAIALLLERGADRNTLDLEYSATPQQWAAFFCHTEAEQLLASQPSEHFSFR